MRVRKPEVYYIQAFDFLLSSSIAYVNPIRIYYHTIHIHTPTYILMYMYRLRPRDACQPVPSDDGHQGPVHCRAGLQNH